MRVSCTSAGCVRKVSHNGLYACRDPIRFNFMASVLLCDREITDCGGYIQVGKGVVYYIRVVGILVYVMALALVRWSCGDASSGSWLRSGSSSWPLVRLIERIREETAFKGFAQGGAHR